MRISWRLHPLLAVSLVMVATFLLWAWRPAARDSALKLSAPGDIATAPDGSLVIVDGERVLRRDPHGSTATLLNRSDGLRNPRDVTVSQGGEVYVADAVGVVEIGRGGRIHRVLRTPTNCVVTDAAGALLVCDSESAEVRRVERDGTTTPLVSSQFAASLGVDEQGRVYVAHSLGITRLSREGISTTLAVASSSGPTADEPQLLTGPTDIVVARDGEVLVADSGSLRLLDAAGQLRTVVGIRSTAKGKPAFAATGVAVDPAGRAIVTDVFNKVIYQVSRDGRISQIGGGVPRSRVNNAALAVADLEPFGRRAALAVAAAVAVFTMSHRHRERWSRVVFVLAATTAAAGLFVLVVGGVFASSERGHHALAGAFFLVTGGIAALLTRRWQRPSPPIATVIVGSYVVVSCLIALAPLPYALAAGLLASVSLLAASLAAKHSDRNAAFALLALAAVVTACAYTGAVLAAPATSGAGELVIACLLIGIALAAARRAIGRDVPASALVSATIAAIALLPYALVDSFYGLALEMQMSVGGVVSWIRAAPLLDLAEPWLALVTLGPADEEYSSDTASLLLGKGVVAAAMVMVVVIALRSHARRRLTIAAGAVLVEVLFAIATTSLAFSDLR